MRISQELLFQAQRLVDYARSNGADEAQITITKSKDFSVSALNGKVEKLVGSEPKSFSVKVIKDKKSATAYSSDFSEATLKTLIDGAIARAKFSGSDEYDGIAENRDVETDFMKLKLYDEKIETLSPEEKIKIALEVEELGLQGDGIEKSSGSSFSDSVRELYIANTSGFLGANLSSSVSAGVYLQSGDAENMIEEGYYASSRSWSGLKSAKEIADEAIKRCSQLKGSRKIKSQTVPVVFAPHMTSMLLRFLAQCLSGRSIYLNQSFLAGKLNKKIGSYKVNIIDDGLIPGGLGSKPFDSDAIPTQKTTLFENGVLKNYLLGLYSSKKLGLEPTGNGSGTNNFYMAAGDESPEDIIKSVDNGLYLTKTLGQGTNPSTGDISKGAYGLWIENGKLTYPVAEITFAGSLGEMLSKVEAVGADLKLDKSVAGPTILVGDVSISGT